MLLSLMVSLVGGPGERRRTGECDGSILTIWQGRGHSSGGVTLRVWAPFASAVAVAGGFNGWNPVISPMEAESDGYWSLDIDGATIGDQYKFVITNSATGEVLWKNDPYALSMTHSAENSIIAATDLAWTTEGYVAPAWNDLVIYELHVGSFEFDPHNSDGRGISRRCSASSAI